MSLRFNESMAAHVLERDTNDSRFEDFCVELLRDVEGIEFVRTSASWDLGKDGTDASASSGIIPPLICATVRNDLQKKAIADVKRVKQKSNIKNVFICTSKTASEHEAEKVEAKIREIAPEAEAVRILGQEKLIQLSVRFPRAIESLYAVELAELRLSFSEISTASEEEALAGLRLALTTQLNTNAQQRRDELLTNLILTSLDCGRKYSAYQIATLVSQCLHLPKKIQGEMIVRQVEILGEAGLVQVENLVISLTEKGETRLKEIFHHSAKRLEVGEKDIRELIESASGDKLSVTEWNQVWRIIKEGISRLLLSHGATIVEAVSSILDGGSIKHFPMFSELVDAIAKRLSTVPGKGGHAEAVAQAFRDMLSEGSSPAFKWLEDLCSIYVDVCSLGLESRSQEQIREILRNLVLILDTDAILSLLSNGEDTHTHVKRLVKGWHEIGGRIGVFVPALEEAAHHARIADIEHEAIWRQMAKLTPDDARRIIENVFVRGFYKNARGHFEPKSWKHYIIAFRGSSDHDHERILGLLGDDHVALIEPPSINEVLVTRLSDALFKLQWHRASTKKKPRVIREKASRDARTIALLLSLRKSLEAEQKTAIIVSAGHGVRAGAAMCSRELADPEAVVYLSAAAWLLSRLPGTQMSENSLRGLLFDVSLRKRLPPLERHIARVLQASEEYSHHWARRNTLFRAVRAKLSEFAKSNDRKLDDVEEMVLSNSAEGMSVIAQAIADVVDEKAVSRSEMENRQLHARIAELESQLRRLKDGETIS